VQKLQVAGVVVSPFAFEEKMNKGETVSRTIHITNTTNEAIPLTISVNDFIPVGRTGQARFLPAKSNADEHFSLSGWVTITKQPNFLLPPGQTTDISFDLTAPQDSDESTHYGGIIITFSGAQQEPGSGSIVKQSIASTIIAKLGKNNGSGRISSFISDKNLYTCPAINFETLFENTGDVHLIPKGKIELKNIFGHISGLAYINPNGQIVLPRTERVFTSPFKGGFMIGRYTAEVTMWFGDPKLEARTKTSFWVLPVKTLLTMSGAAIILLIAAFILLRSYNNWVIRKAFAKKEK
jgi:hypothetical protein